MRSVYKLHILRILNLTALSCTLLAGGASQSEAQHYGYGTLPSDSLCCREYLLGDWCGMRPCLMQHGILADFQVTQFYQGVTSGGNDKNAEYGGKADYFLTIDAGQLGIMEGMTVLFHAETRFGEDIILDAVGLAPSNANMLYPSLENETAITGLQFMQALNEEWALTFGKFNTLDLFNTLYPDTGRGIDGFMNAAAFLPLTVARTIPLSFLGAGVMKLQEGQIQGALIVYDSHNITTTSGFDNLFDNGANILAAWRFFTELGGLPGSHMVMGTWAEGTFTSLDPTGWSFEPQAGITAPEANGSWSALYVLDQKLWVDPCNPQRNLGFMLQAGLADPETSPYEWVGNVSLQAHGPSCHRPLDSMGVAYFYAGLSDDVKALFEPVLPIQDVQGVELYYNAAITPWFHLTADLQVVEPANRANDAALVLGLRANMKL